MLTFTEIKVLLNVLVKHWQSAYLVINTVSRCTGHVASSTSRVKKLPEVVSALNNEVTSLTDMKPVDAIKKLAVSSQPSSKYSRPVDLKVEKVPTPVKIRFWTNLVSWKVLRLTEL